MKTAYEVEIDNIDVDDLYYSFDYIIYVNGVVMEEESYRSDHDWSGKSKALRRELIGGDAARIVLFEYLEV